MKIKRSTLIPAALLVYLAIMSVFGWQQYQAGVMTGGEYYGIIAITLVVIVLLHFNLKRRERLRQPRLNAHTKETEKKQ